MLDINFIAVIVAAFVAFIVGFLLHGPVAGKLWMRLANITPTGNEKFKDMVPQMLWNLLANVVTAYALAALYTLATPSAYLASGICGGIVIAVLVWAGFIVTGSSMEVIWMKRSRNLWIFECVSSLIMMVAMGIVIAIW